MIVPVPSGNFFNVFQAQNANAVKAKGRMASSIRISRQFLEKIGDCKPGWRFGDALVVEELGGQRTEEAKKHLSASRQAAERLGIG